ncbi:MAG TPA: hypothetical protein VJN96_12510 [Vicinamibacterales bacterium]|nr:hypothetical protein [Vicinamibacterales bacterium]
MTNIRVVDRRIRVALSLVASMALALSPLCLRAQTVPARPPDKDIKALIEQVEQNRDKFEGNLSGDLKNSKLRGPNGEMDVSDFLKDYKDNINKLKDRFTDDYSASTELATVLQQGTRIDVYMKNAPINTKGRSEWDREAASLKSLAEAYGTTFPTPEGAPVRRINDKETAQSADAIKTAADHFKDNIDKNSTVPKADRDSAKKEVEKLSKLADAVKSRASDGKPASAEFQQLVTQTAKVQSWIDAHPVPAASADWLDVQQQMTKLRQAFGMR